MKKLKILTAVFAFAMFANMFGDMGSGKLEIDTDTVDITDGSGTATITITLEGYVNIDGWATVRGAGASISGNTVTFKSPGVATITQAWKLLDCEKTKDETPPEDSTVSAIAFIHRHDYVVRTGEKKNANKCGVRYRVTAKKIKTGTATGSITVTTNKGKGNEPADFNRTVHYKIDGQKVISATLSTTFFTSKKTTI